jgi:hypothetical protein
MATDAGRQCLSAPKHHHNPSTEITFAMKLLPYLLSTALASTMLLGCGQEEQNASSAPSTAEPAVASTNTHTHADGSTHAAHDDSDASNSQGHSHGGEVVSLGEKQVLGFAVKAQQEGSVAAGQEAVFLIGTAPAAEAVRLWVGDEQATNSTRAKAEGGPTEYHAHVSVPSPLTTGAQLWIEVQNAVGERDTVAFDLKLADSSASASSSTHSHGGDSHSHAGEAGHSHEAAQTPVPNASAHTHGDGSVHSH